MRRLELIEAAKELQLSLKESGLADLVPSDITNRNRSESIRQPVNVLEMLKAYAIRSSRFDKNTVKLAHIFKLAFLNDVRAWHALLEGTAPVDFMTEPIDFCNKFLPLIIEMIIPDSLQSISPEGKSEYDPRTLLSVIVLEEERRFSSPTRLKEILESITLLYEASAMIAELPPEGLAVIACDSGSDKSFDFLGAAKVIEGVKEILLSLWDRVVFFRERQVSQRIDLIAEALPVIEQIGTLEREGKLGPEQAELLRRKVVNGAGMFIESGAIIPEIQDRSYFNPRFLMAPAPRLLSSGSPEPESYHEHSGSEQLSNGPNSPDRNLEALNEEERSELLRLLNKTRSREARSDSPEENET